MAADNPDWPDSDLQQYFERRKNNGEKSKICHVRGYLGDFVSIDSVDTSLSSSIHTRQKSYQLYHLSTATIRCADRDYRRH